MGAEIPKLSWKHCNAPFWGLIFSWSRHTINHKLPGPPFGIEMHMFYAYVCICSVCSSAATS